MILGQRIFIIHGDNCVGELYVTIEILVLYVKIFCYCFNSNIVMLSCLYFFVDKLYQNVDSFVYVNYSLV